MSDIPVMYVFCADGDTTDADYIGVSKTVTATGAEYTIRGPLAEGLRVMEDLIRKQRDDARAEVERLRREVQLLRETDVCAALTGKETQ